MVTLALTVIVVAAIIGFVYLLEDSGLHAGFIGALVVLAGTAASLGVVALQF